VLDNRDAGFLCSTLLHTANLVLARQSRRQASRMGLCRPMGHQPVHRDRVYGLADLGLVGSLIH